MYHPGLPLSSRDIFRTCTIDSSCPGSVDQNDEDMFEVNPVMLAHGTELNLKDQR